jgi:hypothetical protein
VLEQSLTKCKKTAITEEEEEHTNTANFAVITTRLLHLHWQLGAGVAQSV